MAVLHLTKENFEKEVIESGQKVLVDFWADWCGPCKMLGPVIEELAEEVKTVKIAKVNVDENQELALKYNVMSIPTVILFEGGIPVETSVGYKPKAALKQMIGE
ncbi:MAG: thioredoxin [Lachnospiraceae bacterium]|mgnify:CR=1 FL=1|nr:thioredoxin [Lachnospiraceae bacterium]